jgi:predicted nucleotidyltransferase component of viral defense system
LREVLDPWLGVPRRELNEGLVKLQYRFQSAEGSPLRLKIEINSREHFSAKHLAHMPYEVNSQWFTGKTIITTLPLPVLLGSKLRALYQRKKGRDLFDLIVALDEGAVTAKEIVASFEEHLKKDGREVSRAEFEENLTKKVESQLFISDLGPLLSAEDKFDMKEGYQRVMAEICPLLSGDSWKGLEEWNKG